ncbi:MAG: coenzyme F420 biosynthesis-associated protein [Streptosporangiales bacterium]|nr:coenzyme F420 biosynthesis-associated protein [Streptosporangiales bacterium]
MIDWGLAVATGTRLVRPGPQVGRDEARRAVADLRTLSDEAEHHVKAFTGMGEATEHSPAAVVDRPGWIKANVDGFRVVLDPVVQRMARHRDESFGGTLVTAVGSRVTGLQVGSILAYLAGRVLGQYELFLPPDPDGTQPVGRLTLVAPNVVQVERDLDVDPHDFRLWVCLHEVTHRTQFTAVPWLRDHVHSEITSFLLASEVGPSEILDRMKAAAEAVVDAVRGGDTSLLEAVQSDQQREVLDRLTAVMTLVEGHGDFVMDGVGPDVVPSVAEIREKFQKRRASGNALELAFRRLLGIDLKMKQYEQGSAFVRAVVDSVGMEGFNRVWTSPNTLPTRDEITDPDRWIARVARPGLTDGS